MREFFTYMERSALPVKVCKIWVNAWRSGPLSREGTLSCHTCCDTGPRFSILIQRTGPFSRLLRHTRGCWGLIITRILTGLIQQMVKAVRNGVKGISVVCEDTDVYVLYLHFYAKLNLSCCFKWKDQVLNEQLLALGQLHMNRGTCCHNCLPLMFLRLWHCGSVFRSRKTHHHRGP